MALNNAYEADNRGLLLILKGACLRHMNSPLQAEECLRTVLSLEKRIKEDHYLIPYSMVELGLIVYEQGDKQRAIQILEDAKYVYSLTYLILFIILIYFAFDFVLWSYTLNSCI